MSGTVLVAGGTGAMGSRVVRLLEALYPGVQVLVGAHRRPAPAGRSSRAWDHDEPDVRREALQGVDVLIDSAGPYARDPAPTIRSCVEAGVHYVDLAENQSWMERAELACTGATRAVVPGASTVPGMIEVLAAPLHAREELGGVQADLLMASGQRPGRGMLLSMLEPLGRPMADGRRSFCALSERRGSLFGAYPAPALFLASKRPVPCAFQIGFDRRTWVRGMRVLAPVAGRLPRSWLRPLAWGLSPLARLAAKLGTSAGRLDVTLCDLQGEAVEHVLIRASEDPLEVPALPAVLVAGALLAGDASARGFASVAGLVTREQLASALVARGGSIEIQDPAAGPMAIMPPSGSPSAEERA